MIKLVFAKENKWKCKVFDKIKTKMKIQNIDDCRIGTINPTSKYRFSHTSQYNPKGLAVNIWKLCCMPLC